MQFPRYSNRIGNSNVGWWQSEIIFLALNWILWKRLFSLKTVIFIVDKRRYIVSVDRTKHSLISVRNLSFGCVKCFWNLCALSGILVSPLSFRIFHFIRSNGHKQKCRRQADHMWTERIRCDDEHIWQIGQRQLSNETATIKRAHF